MSIFSPAPIYDDSTRPGSYFFSSRYEAVTNNGWTAIRRGVNNNGRISRDGLVIDADGKTHRIDYDQLSGLPGSRLRLEERTPSHEPVVRAWDGATRSSPPPADGPVHKSAQARSNRTSPRTKSSSAREVERALPNRSKEPMGRTKTKPKAPTKTPVENETPTKPRSKTPIVDVTPAKP